MKYLCFLSILLYSCASNPRPLLDDSLSKSNPYVGKYAEFFDEGEVEIASWYHYVKSRTADSTYILRVFFPETRQITALEHYRDEDLTKINGTAKYWYDDGSFKEEYTYKNGIRHGRATTYRWTNGSKSSEGNYVNGEKAGRWLRYNEDGWLESEEHFLNGGRKGPRIYFDSLQNVTYSAVYLNDTLYKVLQENTIEPPFDYPENRMAILSECLGIEDPISQVLCSSNRLYGKIYEPKKIYEKGKGGKKNRGQRINDD